MKPSSPIYSIPVNGKPPQQAPRSVVIVGPDPTETTALGGHVADVAVLLDELRSRGIEVSVMPAAREEPGLGFGAKLVRGLRRLGRAVRTAVSQRPDLVILLAGAPPSFLEKTAIAGIFRMVGARTLLCPRSGHIARAVRNGSPVLRWMLQIAARVPHAVALQTDGWRDFYISRLSLPPSRAHVVENWVLTPGLEALSDPDSRTENLRIVYAAALHPDKGIDDVLAMVPFLAPVLREHDAVFTILGEGPAVSAVKELSAAFAPHIEWRPPLPRGEFLEFLSGQDILVAPSKVEGFPNLLVEAACLNVAIVASPVGGVRDVIEPDTTGVLVPTGQPSELAAAVEWLIEHPEERRALVDASRDAADRRFRAEANVHGLISAGWPGYPAAATLG